jgi:hypothetical protein
MNNLTAAVSDYLASRFERSYREGEHDCALFALGWIDTLTGTAHEAAFAGTYQTKFEGLRKHAPAGMSLVAIKVLFPEGWTTVAAGEPLAAGDVVITRQGMPGIFDGSAIVTAIQGCAGHARLAPIERKEAFRWLKP